MKFDMDVTANDTLACFWRWLERRGFNPPGHLKVAMFEDTGRGLLTTEMIDENDLIISIPDSLLITTDTVVASRIGPYLKSGLPKLSPLLALCAFLMVERALEAESEWQPYLAVLPEFYSVPSLWPTRFYQYFTYHLQKSVKQQKIKLRMEYETLRPLLKKVQAGHHISDDFMSFKMFCWAWCTVNTRCVYWKRPTTEYFNNDSNHYTLAPYLDFFNHSFDVKVEAGFNYLTKAYEIRAKTKTLRHNQLFVNYGAHDNSTLLLYYGFVIPKNPYSVVIFNLDEILNIFENVFEKTFLEMLKSRILEEKQLIKDLTCTWDGPSWCLTSTVTFLLEYIKYNCSLTSEKVLMNTFENRLVTNRKKQNSLMAIKRSSPLISTLLELLKEENDLLVFNIQSVSS